jgi:NAD(P)-dependent dehydrogenase (short-subunit alcohol dehydrogenase family)
MDYSNKVILVTGASSGIGRATALTLSRHNNTLVITARRQALLDETAALIRDNGSQCMAIAGDALEEGHADSVVNRMIELYGRIDLAILNIGGGPLSNTLTTPRETLLYCMRVNYDSMINFFCPLIRQMKQQTTPCMIVHMNSLATYFGIPMQGDYTAAKGAARLFLETARMELRHFGYKHVRIQTIHPGFVDTEKCRTDGIPKPNEISEDKAAEYVLRGLRSEVRENLFPPGTKWATLLGRIVPHALLTRVLLSTVPDNY